MFHGNSPRILERDVLKSIRYLLDLHASRGELQYWRMNTGPTLVGRGTFIPNKQSAGFPDLLILITNGSTLFVEVKTETGKQSPAQKDFEQRIVASGSNRHYRIWKNVEQAQAELYMFLSLKT